MKILTTVTRIILLVLIIIAGYKPSNNIDKYTSNLCLIHSDCTFVNRRIGSIKYKQKIAENSRIQLT